MKRSRFVLLALCLLTLAAMTGLAPTATAADSFCNKLCAYGFRCVPNPNGGVCVPDKTYTVPSPTVVDETQPVAQEEPAAQEKPVAEEKSAQEGTTDNAEVAKQCLASQAATDVTTTATSECGPCTIFCAYPLHLVQNQKTCQCKCVGGGH